MRALAAGLLVAVAACSSPAPPTPTPPPGGVLVRLGETTVFAEIADSPSERAKGLMHRRHLDADAGMLFVFPSETNGGFWMKNTLIPLSIAFLRREGRSAWRVAALLDMEPCRIDPCPSYRPGTPYELALEVNRGWFAEAGATTGSIAQVEGRIPQPR